MNEDIWLGPWKLSGTSGLRKLTKYADPEARGTAIEWLWEHDNQSAFVHQLREIIREFPPEPAVPKTTGSVSTEYFVRLVNPGESPDFVHGPIDTERDAKLITTVLNEIDLRKNGTGRPLWEAISVKTVIEEKRL